MRKPWTRLLIAGAAIAVVSASVYAAENASGLFDVTPVEEGIVVHPVSETGVTIQINGQEKTVYSGDGELELQYEDPGEDCTYVVFVLEGEASDPSEASIVYMDQNETGTFLINPQVLHSGSYSLYLSGTDLDYEKVATFSYYQELKSQSISFAQGEGVTKTYGDSEFTNLAVNGASDGGAIHYTSSSPDVASVNGETGLITIHSAGETTISAYAEPVDGVYAQAEASYQLTVQPKALAVSGVTLLDKRYDGNRTATVDQVAFSGLVPGDSLERGTDYVADALYDRADPSAAADASANISLLDTPLAGNYTLTNGASFRTQGKILQAIQFADVPENEYYFKSVQWAVARGITYGTSETEFSPDQSCTRAQAVTFLWRAAGNPEPNKTESPFTDVQDPSLYYYKAVLWAVENGITTGTEADTFSPDTECSRAQIVTFLWRYENKPSAGGSNPFTDVTSRDYYYTAVLWASEIGITTGTKSDTFSPDEDCTRAQIVTFLYRDLAE